MAFRMFLFLMCNYIAWHMAMAVPLTHDMRRMRNYSIFIHAVQLAIDLFCFFFDFFSNKNKVFHTQANLLLLLVLLYNALILESKNSSIVCHSFKIDKTFFFLTVICSMTLISSSNILEFSVCDTITEMFISSILLFYFFLVFYRFNNTMAW